MPYGWQFADEDVCIESAKGAHVNCFGLLTRANEFIYQTTENIITSDFIVEQLDGLSFKISKPTVVVLGQCEGSQGKKGTGDAGILG